MRIDARDRSAAPYDWRVWHAEECRMLTSVVWVDDVLAQWGDYARERIPGQLPRLITHQARRIEIFLDRRFVIVNPVDANSSDTETVTAILNPAALKEHS